MRVIAAGQIDFANAPSMQSEIAAARARLGSDALVLDLRGIDFMDSSGLRVIIRLDDELRSEGGALVLFGATDAVRSILSITGLEQHLTAVDTLEQAMRLAAEGTRSNP